MVVVVSVTSTFPWSTNTNKTVDLSIPHPHWQFLQQLQPLHLQVPNSQPQSQHQKPYMTVLGPEQ